MFSCIFVLWFYIVPVGFCARGFCQIKLDVIPLRILATMLIKPSVDRLNL